jgi:hypothetical protein
VLVKSKKPGRNGKWRRKPLNRELLLLTFSEVTRSDNETVSIEAMLEIISIMI